MSERRRGGSRVKDVLLTVAGAVGVLSLVWFAASAAFGFTIVVFMTGSMSPGLPTGSASVAVNDVPAATLSIGDIVTVPRSTGDLPVTHRIIAIDPVEGDNAARSLTLQGDANATPDTEPYVVRTVKRTLGGVPGAGYALQLLQAPLVLGVLTLGAGLLVTWAFWPQPRARRVGPAAHRRDSLPVPTPAP